MVRSRKGKAVRKVTKIQFLKGCQIPHAGNVGLAKAIYNQRVNAGVGRAKNDGPVCFADLQILQPGKIGNMGLQPKILRVVFILLHLKMGNRRIGIQRAEGSKAELRNRRRHAHKGRVFCFDAQLVKVQAAKIRAAVSNYLLKGGIPLQVKMALAHNVNISERRMRTKDNLFDDSRLRPSQSDAFQKREHAEIYLFCIQPLYRNIFELCIAREVHSAKQHQSVVCG